MDWIRTLLTLAFWLVATPVAAAVAIPHALITGRADFLFKVGISVAWAGVRILGIKVTTEGLDRLDPKTPYIFMANHVSNIDPPVFIPLIPRRTSVLVKNELFRVPILGTAMRVARLVPVDRTNRERAVESLRKGAAVLRDGISMTVFVEGTRSYDGRLLPFKKGPFYLAMESGVAVVPVTIAGTHALQPKGQFKVRSGPVRLVFHEPLDPRNFGDRESLMAAVRERIESALPAHQRDEVAFPS